MMRASRTPLVLGMITLLPMCAIGLPLLLEARGMFTQIMPATVLMLGAMGHHAWKLHRQRFDERGMVNEVSGQPNLNALRAAGHRTARMA